MTRSRLPKANYADTAMEDAFSLIRQLENNGPNPLANERHKTGYPMMGVKVHMGRVIHSLVNMGFAMNTVAIKEIMKRGDEWVYDIRHHTPQGQVRTMPIHAFDVSAAASRTMSETYYARRQISVPADAYSFRIWKRDAAGVIEDIRKEHVRQGRMWAAEEDDAPDSEFVDMAAKLIQSGYNGEKGRKDFKWGGDQEGGMGSLWSSIAVRGMKPYKEGGQIQMVAYSNNHYAGYVNDGFQHGLIPILRRAHGGREGQLMGRKFKLYTILSVARLGHYPIWDVFEPVGREDSGGKKTQDWSVMEGFAYDKEANILTPGKNVVDFAERTSPKMQEGKHMFERGTQDFMARLGWSWQSDVDKIMKNAFDRNLNWSWMEKSQQGRFRRGKGAGGGQFAAVPK